MKSAYSEELNELKGISESDQKRLKIEQTIVQSKQTVPPVRYTDVKVVHLPKVTLCNEKMEFARLSNGKNLLLSNDIYDVLPSGNVEGPIAEFEHEFARVPGYDYVVTSLKKFNEPTMKICVFSLPGLVLMSSVEVNIRLDGPVANICSDKTSSFGLGRVLVSSNSLLYLIDISKDGQATITSCVDMESCPALDLVDGEKNLIFTITVPAYLLYHDPLGNPLALVCGAGGRIVFLSLSGSHCVSPSIYSKFSIGIRPEKETTLESLNEENDVSPSTILPRISLKVDLGSVLPRRVLHAHHGTNQSTRSQTEARVYEMRVWEPTAGGGKKLVSVGSDGCIAISHLDDGTAFSNDSLPYKCVKVTVRSRHPIIYLAVHGDVAFTALTPNYEGTFWDLSSEKGPTILSNQKLRKEFAKRDFSVESLDFSDDGVLGIINTHEHGLPIFSLLIPNAIQSL